MDPTPACRDKCASSADMLSCLSDCTGRSAAAARLAAAGPVSPIKKAFKAAMPKLFGDVTLFAPENRKSTAMKAVVLVAAVAGGVWLYKHKKATGKFF